MGAFIENNPTVIVGIFVAVAGIFYWAGSIHKSVHALEGFMEEIRNDIKKIFERLPSSTTGGHSPIQLTDLGKKVSEEIQASIWAEQSAPTLAAQNRGKGHYDIQEFCLKYVQGKSALSDEMDRRVKSSAYNNGIDKEQVLRVLAVELRNALLELLNMNEDVNY